MEKLVVVALCLDHNGKCVSISKVCNVSEKDYARYFLEMQEHNAEIDRKFDDLQIKFERQEKEYLDEIAELKQEIKVLKGED